MVEEDKYQVGCPKKVLSDVCVVWVSAVETQVRFDIKVSMSHGLTCEVCFTP